MHIQITQVRASMTELTKALKNMNDNGDEPQSSLVQEIKDLIDNELPDLETHLDLIKSH
jgi:hypothetical protein